MMAGPRMPSGRPFHSESLLCGMTRFSNLRNSLKRSIRAPCDRAGTLRALWKPFRRQTTAIPPRRVGYDILAVVRRAIIPILVALVSERLASHTSFSAGDRAATPRERVLTSSDAVCRDCEQ